MEHYYIKKVKRTDRMFQNRSLQIISFDGITNIPVPNNEILCDVCNIEIETEDILLLAYEYDYDEHFWGALCQKCKDKYLKNIQEKKI